MAEEKKHNTQLMNLNITVVALVALVAIVGLTAIVLKGRTAPAAIRSDFVGADKATSNTAGNAFHSSTNQMSDNCIYTADGAYCLIAEGGGTMGGNSDGCTYTSCDDCQLNEPKGLSQCKTLGCC